MSNFKVGDIVDFVPSKLKDKNDYCFRTYGYSPIKHYIRVNNISDNDIYVNISFHDKNTHKEVRRTNGGGFSKLSLRKVDVVSTKEELLCLKIKYLWDRQHYVRNKRV